MLNARLYGLRKSLLSREFTAYYQLNPAARATAGFVHAPRVSFSTGGQNGNNGGGNPFAGFNNMNDIFSRFGDFFGGGSQRQVRRGSDLRIKVNVTLNDIINGVDKKLKYIRQVKCNTCDGIGGRDLTNCGICQGTGQRRRNPMSFLLS